MGRKSAGDYSPDGVGVLDPRHIAPGHENMRKAIQARGHTLEQFATLMNVAPSTLGRWLSGDEDNAKANRLPNEALVKAARVLGVSVWYLLDLTDSPDGSGAEPFRRYEVLRGLWAKDPEKAAPECELINRDGDGVASTEDVIVIWHGAEPEAVEMDGYQAVFTVDERLPWHLHGMLGYKYFVPTIYDCWELRDMWAEAATSYQSFDPETGDLTPEGETALDGYDAWERWFRANAAESLKRDLLALRGDYRDPLTVVRVELEYASKAADRDKFDALLARIDAEAREAMDALA